MFLKNCRSSDGVGVDCGALGAFAGVGVGLAICAYAVSEVNARMTKNVANRNDLPLSQGNRDVISILLPDSGGPFRLIHDKRKHSAIDSQKKISSSYLPKTSKSIEKRICLGAVNDVGVPNVGINNQHRYDAAMHCGVQLKDQSELRDLTGILKT